MADNKECFVPYWRQGQAEQGPQYSEGAPSGQQEASLSQALDAILSYLQRLNSALVPQGLNDFFEGSVNSEGIRLQPVSPAEAWYSIFIENTGGNNLYFRTNVKSPNSDDPYITPGNSFSFDPGRNVVKSIDLYSPAATMTTYKVYCAK